MTRRNNCDEPSRLAKERRVVTALMEERGEGNGVAAIAKSKQPAFLLTSV
jgi:hypothetical protein